MKALLLVVLSVGGATGLALQPEFSGTWKLWVITLIPYLPLSLWAISDLRKRGTLHHAIKLQGGDTSIGIIMGMSLVAGGLVFLKNFAEAGSDHFAWMFQIYAQVGEFQQDALFLAFLILTIALEELVWRGLVLQRLKDSIGAFAIPASALLYAAAQAPTLLALHDPNAGLNPLVMAAALACGLCWAAAATWLKRLYPVALSHAIFTFFLAAPLPVWLHL